jgi:hypothetical protein
MQRPISFEPVRYRLSWVREIAPGQIESDLGLEVTPEQLLPALAGLRPADKPIVSHALVTAYGLHDAFRSYRLFSLLPVWCVKRLSVMFGEINSEDQLADARSNLQSLAALAETVHRNAPFSGPVEVHLPYLDFDAWGRRFEILKEVRFGYHCGRMFPSAIAANQVAATAYQALLAGSTSYGSGQHFTLAGWDRAISGSACGAWRAIPPEKHPRCFTAMCGISTAIQRALRRYVRNRCIRRDPEALSDPSRSWPLLAYAYSSPFPGRRPRQLVYDQGTTGWIYDLVSSARAPLRIAVKKFQMYFWEIGRSDLSQFYARVRAKQIVDWARNEHGTLSEVIALEAAVIHRFVQWGNVVAHSTEPHEIETACSSFAADLHSLLRRLPGGEAAPQLPSLLLTEATCGLNWALGGRQKMTQIRLSKQIFDSSDDFLDGNEIRLLSHDHCYSPSPWRPNA